jgi:hypothetical protein
VDTVISEFMKIFEYLALDVGAGIVTETGQIKTINKFKYLGSVLERAPVQLPQK